MIRNAMRINKSQIPIDQRTVKFITPQTTVFNKAKFVQAGFTMYSAYVIGAAGGYSAVVSVSGGTRFGCAGGGGSSKRVSGYLSDLPVETTVLVGEVGYGGNPTTDFGGRGATSWFGSVDAPGGYGAVGAVGGRGCNPDGSAGSTGGSPKIGTGPAAVLPTTGVWSAALLQGGGGGGGGGAWTASGVDPQGKGQYGGSGSVDASNGHTAPGGAPAPYPPLGLMGVMGGRGSGVNVNDLTGSVEYYGQIHGAVIIKIS